MSLSFRILLPLLLLLASAPASLAQIVQITDNDVNDWTPDISGDHVVWVEGSHPSYDILLWDGATTTPLATNGSYSQPRISGDRVVWTEGVGVERLWDNGVLGTVPGSGSYVTSGDIDGSNVVWAESPDSDSTKREIYAWDGSLTTQVTNNALRDQMPEVAGNRIAWLGNDGTGDLEVFLRDGATTLQLTDTPGYEGGAGVSGNRVAWNSGTAGQLDIYVFDGNTTIQLTDTPYQDSVPAVSDDYVAWTRALPSRTDLLFWDGSAIWTLDTPTAANASPRLDGSMLTWAGYDGSDWEIFKVDLAAAPVVPEPGTGLLWAAGLAVALRRRSR